MDERTGRERLEEGDWIINAKRPMWDRRQRYLTGDHDLPYAPEGVNEEYVSLQVQAIQNWLWLAMNAPLDRMRAIGFRPGKDAEPDQAAWTDVWQANSMDSRQLPVYRDMYVHKRGIVSVWTNPANKKQPVVRPESSRDVHIEGDPDDPWTQLWGVKRYNRTPQKPRVVGKQLWVPVSSGVLLPQTTEIGMVFDRAGRDGAKGTWQRWERTRGYGGGDTQEHVGDWKMVDDGEHDNFWLPLVPYDYQPNSKGEPMSAIDALIPPQDAINTIRFQTLLAMQFSAYRQRIVVGFDPVARDSEGNPLYRKDSNGDPILDANQMPIPIVVSPGRPGVDRLMVFPGTDTNVFDLAESNLDNYIKVLGTFLSQLFGQGQIPPQYNMGAGGFSNANGDMLVAAESSLESLRQVLETSAGESNELVMRQSGRLRGDEPDLASETIWDPTRVRSFAQLVDAIVKLVSTGMDPQDAWAMLPGATPPQIKIWVDHSEERLRKALTLAGAQPGAAQPAGGIPLPGITPPKPAPGAQPGGTGGRSTTRSGQ